MWLQLLNIEPSIQKMQGETVRNEITTLLSFLKLSVNILFFIDKMASSTTGMRKAGGDGD